MAQPPHDFARSNGAQTETLLRHVCLSVAAQESGGQAVAWPPSGKRSSTSAPVAPNRAGCRLRVRLAVFPEDLAHAHCAAGTNPGDLVGRDRWQSLAHAVAQGL